jgi:hypothetical protein
VTFQDGKGAGVAGIRDEISDRLVNNRSGEANHAIGGWSDVGVFEALRFGFVLWHAQLCKRYNSDSQ